MKYEDIIRSDFPYPKPSFLRGFASALNLFGNSVRRDKDALNDEEDDARAIAHDWEVVGRDMKRAFERAGCK
jgi:hypothetical protein